VVLLEFLTVMMQILIFEINFRKTQMQKCLIPIRLGNCKARALLDSDSTISAINGNLFQKSEFASLPLKTPKVPHIIGAGGATHPIQGQIDLQFSIGGLLLSNI
jgi:hypothetical protein